MTNNSGALGFGWVDRRRALGAILRRARQPMSRAEVAAAIGRPTTVVAAWERGGIELGLDRLYALEELFHIRHGVVLGYAGYLAPNEMQWWHSCHLGVRRRPIKAVPSELTRFPAQAAAWLADHGPVLEAAALLRDDNASPVVIEQVLGLVRLVELKLAWSLWSEQTVAAGLDPDEVLAGWVLPSVIIRCRYALWGPLEGSCNLHLVVK